jgi:tetratricopeptide (TPR) repeat protein
MRGMRRLASFSILFVALFVGAVAGAEEDEGTRARMLFERGMAHFQLEEYTAAIAKWEDGFRLKPVPEFLYNIAQAYRLSKQSEKALSFYKKFLRLKPEAANRAEVENHIRELSRLVSEQDRTANLPPTQPITPGKKRPVEEPEIAPSAPGTPAAQPEAPAQPSTPVATVEKKPDKEPVTKKKWFWPVIGSVAGVVVIAVVVGAVVGTSGDSMRTIPGVSF